VKTFVLEGSPRYAGKARLFALFIERENDEKLGFSQGYLLLAKVPFAGVRGVPAKALLFGWVGGEEPEK